MSKKIPDSGRVVLTTFGSFGDVHPYVALALEMKGRGLEPVIATGDTYRKKIEALGIEFRPVRPSMPELDSPEAVEMIDRVMDPRRGAEYLFRGLLAPAARDSYEDLQAASLGADLLVTHPVTLAGPVLAQKTGIPWVSTALAPSSIWSDYDPPVPPNAPLLQALLRLGGPPAARVFKRLIEAATRPWVKPVYGLRKELGLPAGAHPIFAGQYSPALNLGLFSRVLSGPQADWPANTIVTGFPFYDKKDDSPADPRLQSFLDGGPPPIVFTLGSAAVHVAGDFYRESIGAARMLGRRAVILAGADRNRPAGPLPEGVAVFDYAPYGELLPRAAAVVHHGGVGTTGQTLRAGVPALVMPYNHDQPDNAARVARLGVARTITRDGYRAARVAKELKELLEDPSYARRAGEVGREVRAEGGAAAAVETIVERLRAERRSAAPRPRRAAVA